MPRALRIVHCFRSPVGGIFRHVRDLAEAQSAAGHAVGIVCDSSTGGAFEAGIFENIQNLLALGVSRTPMQRHVGLGDIAAARRTYGIIKELKPDVLHGHGAKGGVYARLFGSVLRASRSRVARVYSPHGGSLHYDEKTATGRSFFAAERMMARFTDHLLFVSDFERRTYYRKVGGPNCPHSLVYNGLREHEFAPITLVPDAADFLYVGMMRDLKGPDLFIEALKRAQDRIGRALTAVLVGDGDDLPRYHRQVAGHGLSNQVLFHPAMPARDAFRLGRIIVVPSRAEAMPYIVLEAIAAGKTMIASNVGGIPEILGEHSPALVEPDANALAAKFAAAISDPAALEAAMPPAASLRRRFGADVMARQIEAVYMSVLG